MSSSLLIAAALAVAPPAGSAPAPASTPDPAPLPTAAELADGLTRVRAAMDDVHLVWRERVQMYAAPNVPVSAEAYWRELFLSGDAAQIRTIRGPAPPGGRPAGTASGVPLTGETAANYDGMLISLRPPGDGPVRAQLMGSVVRGPGAYSDTLYATHLDYEPVVFQIPHTAAGRPWDWEDDASPPNLIDRLAGLADTNPAGWVVEGREVKDGRPAIRVSATKWQPHRDGATLTAGLRAWFTDDGRHDLFRVEEAEIRWLFGEILLKESEKNLWRRAARADDFRPLPGGARVPFSGGEIFRAIAPAPPGADAPSPPDRSDESTETPERFVAQNYEWRIETLEPLDPAIAAADLWVEPPHGAQWYDAATGEQRIVGLTELESWLIFKFGDRYAAWWAFGPPLGLCALAALGLWWRRRRRRWVEA